MKIDKTVSRLAVILILAEVALVLLSWLLSATITEGVRTLLSAEGVRWFCAHFTEIICSSWLGWLIVLSMAWGSVSHCLVFKAQSSKEHLRGITMSLFLLIIYIGGILLLSCLPHAILLSATGSLWNSPFSHALVPIVAFGMILGAIGYGIMTRAFTSVSDICSSLYCGIAKTAPLFLLYVLAIQFWASFRYTFLYD